MAPKPTLYPVKRLVPLTAEQAKRIAEYRWANRLNSENEAIRQLIERGLETEGARPSTRGKMEQPK